jgi:hypothetical protein
MDAGELETRMHEAGLRDLIDNAYAEMELTQSWVGEAPLTQEVLKRVGADEVGGQDFTTALDIVCGAVGKREIPRYEEVIEAITDEIIEDYRREVVQKPGNYFFFSDIVDRVDWHVGGYSEGEGGKVTRHFPISRIEAIVKKRLGFPENATLDDGLDTLQVGQTALLGGEEAQRIFADGIKDTTWLFLNVDRSAYTPTV